MGGGLLLGGVMGAGLASGRTGGWGCTHLAGGSHYGARRAAVRAGFTAVEVRRNGVGAGGGAA